MVVLIFFLMVVRLFVFFLEEEIKCTWKTEFSPIKSFFLCTSSSQALLVELIISGFFLKEDWEL